MSLRRFFIDFLLLASITLAGSFNFDVCSPKIGEELKVSFGSLQVSCHSMHSLDAVSSPPVISFPKADKEKLYEVLMLDPDAPSHDNPACQSWVHMILSNVPVSELAKGISAKSKSNIITGYNPPAPPSGSGYHRYVVLVFAHKSPLHVEAPSGRCGFDIDKFTKMYSLSQTPDATNMFETKRS